MRKKRIKKRLALLVGSLLISCMLLAAVQDTPAFAADDAAQAVISENSVTSAVPDCGTVAAGTLQQAEVSKADAGDAVESPDGNSNPAIPVQSTGEEVLAGVSDSKEGAEKACAASEKETEKAAVAGNAGTNVGTEGSIGNNKTEIAQEDEAVSRKDDAAVLKDEAGVGKDAEDAITADSVQANGIHYIDKIVVTYNMPEYHAGDTPQAVAAVTEGNCHVAYEYWQEIEQKEANGFWSGTGRYWYSDQSKMEALPLDKRITKFEAGKHYDYNIVLAADKGYFINEDTTRIFVGDFDWGTVNRSTNLAIKDMSTTLKIYSITGVDLPADQTVDDEGKTINNIDIEDAAFDYFAGDQPRATASGYDEYLVYYDVAYECWEEMETDENGESVPVAYWYSDETMNSQVPEGKRITSFQPGRQYMYSIMLKAYDDSGYTFATPQNGLSMMVNGSAVNARNITVGNDGKTLFATAIKTIRPQQVKAIDVVEVNDVTLNFKDGDKPVFTGEVPDGANYKYRCEWWQQDSKTGVVSTEPQWGSGIYENHITAFKAGKTYHYGVYLSAHYGYKFTSATRLKINGKFVNYQRPEEDIDNDPDNMGTMWVYTDLAMTPAASGHIRDTEEKPTETPDAEDNPAETSDTKGNSEKTSDTNGSPAETTDTYGKLAKDTGNTGKLTENADAKGKSTKAVMAKGKSPKAADASSPQTGDIGSLTLCVMLLAASCIAVGGMLLYIFRQKRIHK